jgi:virulence-associated protein VapD
VFVALALLERGGFEDARQLVYSIRRDVQAHPQLMAAAEILARTGQFGSAVEIVEDLKLFSLNSPISSLRQVSLALALDDKSAAIAALITSY